MSTDSHVQMVEKDVYFGFSGVLLSDIRARHEEAIRSRHDEAMRQAVEMHDSEVITRQVLGDVLVSPKPKPMPYPTDTGEVVIDQ